MTEKILASDADRLLRDPAFAAIIDKVRSEQIMMFVNSSKHDTASREEAHAMLRCLSKIEAALKSVITEEAIKQKREGRS